MAFKIVGINMPEEMSDRIDECVAHLGVKRMAWVRGLIAEALAKEGFPIDPALLKPNQGARNDLPNRVTEAEKRARKGLRPRGRPRKLRVELGGGSSGLIPARIDSDGALRPLTSSPERPERSRRESAA